MANFIQYICNDNLFFKKPQAGREYLLRTNLMASMGLSPESIKWEAIHPALLFGLVVQR